MVADYLIQHASRERRAARLPASTWDALLSHIQDPADTARLADSARSRLRYRYAIILYRHAADAGDRDALQLADLLARRGALDQAEGLLQALADDGDQDAAWWLAELLAQRGDLDGLRARADTDDEAAARWRAEVLAQRGELDETLGILWAQADAWRQVGRPAPGRAAETARRPGPGHKDPAPTRRRRGWGRRLAAGRAAGTARRPGPGHRNSARPRRRWRRAARPRRRQATSMPPGTWPAC
jgi:hypothetical protein